MSTESDEVMVNYFLLCDQVIVDMTTRKHSLIGIYSGIIVDHLPVQLTIAVAMSARVQSATPREFSLRLSALDGAQVLATPPLPYDWKLTQAALERFNQASVQLGIHLQRVNITMPGSYTAAMYCDHTLLATYPLQVAVAPAGPAEGSGR
jgi:hypothetical protein